MADTKEQHILDIQVSYDQAVQGIMKYKKEIEALKAGIDKAVEKKEKSVGFDKWLGYLLMHAKGLSLEELIEAGKQGLKKAVMKYDTKADYKFISYAVWWIRQAMIQAIAEKE